MDQTIAVSILMGPFVSGDMKPGSRFYMVQQQRFGRSWKGAKRDNGA